MEGCLLGLQRRGPDRKEMLQTEDSVSTSKWTAGVVSSTSEVSVDNQCSDIRQAVSGGVNGNFAPRPWRP